MEIYQTIDVFTPSSPATLTFVEREGIRTKITNSLRTKGKQLVIYGPSKSGKSTLINNKLEQLYENYITTYCSSDMKIDSLILDAFDQLDPYYITEKKGTKTKSVSSTLSAEYSGIKASITALSEDKTETTKGRIIPPQLNSRRLGQFIGEINACWVIEDFHKISNTEKQKFSDIMKNFMDLSFNYDSLKIIAIGAENTAREVVEYDSNMEDRVSEILVPLLSDTELKGIISKGENLLNIEIPEHVNDLIIQYSKGLGSVCHQLCLNMCFADDIDITCGHLTKINSNLFRDALRSFVEDSSDSIKKIFDKTLKKTRTQIYNNCELIIGALSIANSDGLQFIEIQQNIHKVEPNYPNSNLQRYLNQLTKEKYGEILSYDENSGKYYFREPFYHTYAHALFSDQDVKALKKAKKRFNVDTMDLQAVEEFIAFHLERDVNSISNVQIRWDEQ